MNQWTSPCPRPVSPAASSQTSASRSRAIAAQKPPPSPEPACRRPPAPGRAACHRRQFSRHARPRTGERRVTAGATNNGVGQPSQRPTDGCHGVTTDLARAETPPTHAGETDSSSTAELVLVFKFYHSDGRIYWCLITRCFLEELMTGEASQYALTFVHIDRWYTHVDKRTLNAEKKKTRSQKPGLY